MADPTGLALEGLEAALFGLLSVRWDATFADASGATTARPWLVLHVDLVRAPTPQAFSSAVHAALDAVGRLCAHHDVATEGFWTSVLSSSMIRASEGSDSTIQPVNLVRAINADGLKLLLSWEDRPFQPIVASAIHAFLETPRPTGAAQVVDGVGIRVARCGINASSLRQLSAVFQRPDTSTSTAYLFDATALYRLDLSDNALGPAELQAIAELLESPSSRCVREIMLERTIQVSETVDCSAFQRVLAAIANATTGALPGNVGLSISLAHNELREAHFSSLHKALVHSTRELRELCLEGVSTDPQGWAALARLVFTDVPALDGCHLNVSGLCNIAELVPALLSGLTELVVASMDTIQQALDSNTRVRCRVFDPVVKPPASGFKQARKAKGKGNAQKEHLVRPDLTEYDVVAVDSAGERIQAARPGSASGTQWYGVASIASIVIGDKKVVGSTRVAGLTVDSRIEHNALLYCTDLTIARLMPVMGPHLRQFCIRGECDQNTPPGAILRWCSRLEVLDVSQWARYQLKWLLRDLDADTFQSLHTIRLSRGNVSESEMTALLAWLEAATERSLRRLTLRCYSIPVRALHVLVEIVQTLPAHVQLDVDWNREADDADAAAAIAVIDARLGQRSGTLDG